jgi:hypothetical protein
MRTILPLAFLCALAPGLSCNNGYGVLLAKQVQNAGELVGGPVAMATVGDFLLQNDQIKINILGAHDSPGPGVFGGSIVDVDLRRDRLGFEGAQGHDRFAELFPVANLLVPYPDPTLMQVTVLEDGSNGTEAAIRVTGQGTPLFEALGILHTEAETLRLLFPQVKTSFSFQTDYIVQPGWQYVKIVTTIGLQDAPTATVCAVTPQSCDLPSCPYGLEGDGNGCFTCNCAQPVALDQYHGSVSVFGQVFGDNQNMPESYVHSAGVVAGDFVFFGAQNGVFAPGAGYDLDTVLHTAFYTGHNTFQQPLTFDFVTASGGDVSYGYFTKAAPGDTQPVTLDMPIFTSAASAFLTAGKSCGVNDTACNASRAFTWERYLAVGQGDVASVSDVAWKTRGTPTGTLQGVVFWDANGDPALQSHVYVFRDPQPGHGWASLDDLVNGAQSAFGDYGIVDVIDADAGLPLVLDGSFHATLPAGDYVMVARSSDGMATSVPESFHMDAGAQIVIDPSVLTPGSVQYRVTDGTGALIPAKVALVSLDAQGQPLEGDGLRRVFMGDARLGNGVRVFDYSTTGQGSINVEPGSYRFRASRGPEYGIFEQDVQIGSSGVALVNAVVPQEVDTTGWMSTDMHIHATDSFDSGMALDKRLATIVSEGVELAVSTDHDFVTDYDPTRRANFLEPYVQTAVGVETTTIEMGHFIGFPLSFDNTIVPTHGSPDPTCDSGGQIVSALQGDAASASITPFTILAHPRDGFFGYMYQLGVDPYTMQRQVGSLEAANPVLQTATCSFDGMELINGKRFDLVRTPTIGEVVDWNLCHARLEAATDPSALPGLCPELAQLGAAPWASLPCNTGERFSSCLARNRTAMAWAFMKKILTRTPAEQAAQWGFAAQAPGCGVSGTACTGDAQCCSQKCGNGQCTTPSNTPMIDSQPMCNVAQYAQSGVPAATGLQPCNYYAGHVDDYFRYLEHGMLKTHVASSDSHEAIHEPGYPRTYFQSATDEPLSLSVSNAVQSLRAGTALTTYGPFMRGSVGGKTFGEVAPATQGGQVALALNVQSASWFGVDRIEIYVDGTLAKELTTTSTPQGIHSTPQDLVDFDDTVMLDVPKRTGDSWIVVIAMGLQDQNLMRPVSLDIPYGEIQLSIVTADAFALIPVVNTFFSAAPALPDWFPIPAYAVSNPIYLDTDGNGKYDAPLPAPAFCSVPCDPNGANTCAGEQGCVPNAADPSTGLCGYAVSLQDTCAYRQPWSGGNR